MKTYKIKNSQGTLDTFVFNPLGKKGERYKLNGVCMTGVTTALGVINKPKLLGWAARSAYEDCLDLVTNSSTNLPPVQKVIETILKEKKYAHTRKSKGAMDVGKEAHAWVEKWANNRMKGIETALPVDESIKRIVEPFVEWADGKIAQANKSSKWDKKSIALAPTVPVKVLATEQSVFSRKYFYAGTFDLVLEIDGKKYICDFKTSSGIYGREYFAQCAAYRYALEEMGWDKDIAGSVIIRSGKEGKDFEVAVSTDYTSDFKLFTFCLGIYKNGYCDFDADY